MELHRDKNLALSSHIVNTIDIMRGYVERKLEEQIVEQIERIPVIALLGPRQCGKSTLAAKILQNIKEAIILDLERPADLRALSDPETFFKVNDEKLICIDEVQNQPDLFPVLRYESDRRGRNGQFLILGSASPLLIRQSSESLAGRITYLELTPFLLNEIETPDLKMRELWLKGGFPRSFLAGSLGESIEWRTNFIRTFLERDIPSLGINISTKHIHRLWTMLAHSSGQVMNYSKLSESLGVSRNTVRHYIDILEQTYMVRVLNPYFSNSKKRLVKSPKVYIRDSGILHSLLEIEDQNSLLSHPIYGQSWEGFALENILAAIDSRWKPSFYRSEKGNEIDLILEKGLRRICLEFKASSAPKVGKGFWIALEELKPEKTWIVAPVERTYPLDGAQNIWVGSIDNAICSIQL